MSSLDAFVRKSEQIIEFDATFADMSSSDHTQFSLEIFRDELKALWGQVKTAYDAVLGAKKKKERDPSDADDSQIAKAKHSFTFKVYVACLSKINEMLQSFKSSLTDTTIGTVNDQPPANHLKLPACDTEVFKGDYLSWPTFRDMFTAVYVNNSRLSNVERLYHLIHKTSGEAKEIVQKSPLTNLGFDLAWENLKETYENKRILVNSQLKLLFELQHVNSEDSTALKNLQRGINNSLSALQLYKVDVTNWDPILVYFCCQRLPHVTLSLWEQSLTDKTLIPKWSSLDAFLTERYKTLESIIDIKGSSSSKFSNKKPTFVQPQPKRLNAYHSNIAANSCVLCSKQQHTLRSCPKFLNLNVSERFLTVKKHSCCINCLTKNHSVKECRSTFNCSVCKKRHHTLLHKNSSLENPIVSGSRPTDDIPSGSGLQTSSTNISQTFHNALQSTLPSVQSLNSRSTSCSSVLLGTARVLICHLGVTYSARALIDSASEASFISERLQRLLKLPIRSTRAIISGVNQKVSANPSQICSFTLGSLLDSNLQIEATAMVLPQITGNLPSASLVLPPNHQVPNFQLADVNFLQSEPVDVLIGGDLYPLVMLDGVKRKIFGSLLAQETVFGWILTGSVSTATVSCFATNVKYTNETSLDLQIKRFWELEEVPKKKFVTSADQICEEIFQKTTRRDSDGKYIVSLPFKNNFPTEIKLGSSRHIAYKQFLRNEASLLKNPSFKECYDNVVTEYLYLNHMEKVESPQFDHFPSHCYLPHHSVVKPDSRTTALRVVFNATSATANGSSLNDVLYVGPVLQADLMFLILRWRIFQYVFNSDIQKMYRQILVEPSHRPFQRILFRKSSDEEISDYQLKTVTFGVNCAPYLAIRTLLQLAQDTQKDYPLAAYILRKCMYVDDVLAGAHDIPTALKAKDELIKALGSAGFLLRKWTSNSKQIIEDIPKDHLLDTDFLDLEDSSHAKALGVRWNARYDHFYFIAESISSKQSFTKREVLSTTAKLFDPAGWLGPIIVVAKIIMQQVWLDQTQWDEILAPQTLLKWQNFVKNYRFINEIKIPRWIQYTESSAVQIHAFSDASEKAYAGAIYVRVETVNEIFCWTDSTIVLSWLRKPPCSWTCFVANRVAKIQESNAGRNWYHVDTKDNPADLGSRGSLPQELCDNDLWWHGPSWLKLEKSSWPLSESFTHETTLELKVVKTHATFFNQYEDILDRFSSLSRAFRVIAYIFRFFNRSRKNQQQTFNHLWVSGIEIANVRSRLIMLSQKVHYPEDYKLLLNKLPLSSKSSILTLNPYLDSKSIMRVNGRLTNSPILSFNEKHPILLPYGCRYAQLLVKFIHDSSLHGGNQLVLRLVRQQYWIPKAKNLIKTTINKCKTCILAKKKQQNQIMAALPLERTILSRPFETTGIDFAGPIDVKSYAGRACRLTKGYVCVFICFSTKAIHLEPTSDLSSTTFLAAFTRFVSRRGCPLKIFSDNGTNFVGASKTLKTEFQQFISSSQEKVCTTYSSQEVRWNFIPAGAPHMGGLWEAGVKSFKTLFRKMAINHKYTFEELGTLFCRIEACLNSRPLSPMSSAASDYAALTPGHFLIGTPILVPAEPSIEENPLSLINRWQRLKAFAQEINLRWKEEYLKELHKRYKWKYPMRDIAIDDLVVVRQENLPATEWRLGRIVKVYQGNDKRVRVTDIKTQKGVITRPLVKLIVLPN